MELLGLCGRLEPNYSGTASIRVCVEYILCFQHWLDS